MRSLHKPKRVSWPPDFKLCQVRLFLSEDSPSQVGSESQDFLQAKSHPNDDNLPPGFGGLHEADNSLIKLSDIPVIKWKRSIKILLDEEWRVVDGDETKEVETQNQRELRVLEAFYPAASAIPSNPSVPADVDDSHYDDQQTIVIPILPVEDDETTDSASDCQAQPGVNVRTETSIPNENNTPTASSTLPSGSDIIAALSAFSNSKEQGGNSMIDQDLLMKILNNPKLVENLVATRGGAGSASNTSDSNGVVSTAIPAASSNEQFYPQPMVNSHMPPSIVYPPAPSPDQPNYGQPPARDASYYKNLIHKHGGERQEIPPPVQQHVGYRYNFQPGGGPNNPEMVNSNNNQRTRDSKPQRMRKPCTFFNSPIGCRNGANCLYQHDTTTTTNATTAYQPRNFNNGNNINNTSEMQNAKRMRFDN